MACLTAKRITYFLMIRQLRFDNYMFVASELERKFFNSLGNIKMSDIEPSDQLQKIIGSSAICSELLLNAQSSLEELNKMAGFTETPLRRPLSDFPPAEDGYVVSQNSVPYPVTPIHSPPSKVCDSLTAPENHCDNFHSIEPLDISENGMDNTFPSTSHSEAKELKRGRLKVKSSDSSSLAPSNLVNNTHQTGELLDELERISHELKAPEQPCNSFLGLNNDVTDDSTLGESSQTATSHRLKQSSEETDNIISPDVEELPSCYTQYKIIKVTDSDAQSHTPSPGETPALTSNEGIQSKSEQTVGSCSNNNNTEGSSSKQTKPTPAHRLNKNKDLLNLDYASKMVVLQILAEGWKVQVAFEKIVRKHITFVGKSSLEEILYAVFGFETSNFVEFKHENKKLSIRLNPSFNSESFETILTTVEGL